MFDLFIALLLAPPLLGFVVVCLGLFFFGDRPTPAPPKTHARQPRGAHNGR